MVEKYLLDSRWCSAGSTVRVLMIPFDAVNPYQRLLKAALEQKGAIVLEGKVSRWLSLGRIGLWGRGVDVVHLHWLHPLTLTRSAVRTWVKGMLFLLHILVLRLAGKRLVWTAHNIRPHEPRYPKLDRLVRLGMARIVHRIIAHCPAAKTTLAASLQLRRADKIQVIPHGHYIGCYPNHITPEVARQQLRVGQEEFVMLFLGNVRPYKGVEAMIDAFKGLRMPSIRLVIAGRVHLDTSRQEILQAIDGDERIVFHEGFIPDERIQVYMNASDVVIFPYRQILTSGAVVLAMSFGHACIAPRIGCIGETLDEQGALIFDANDEEGLEKAMHIACERRHELHQMGQVNLRKAEQWDWEKIASMTLKTYSG